MDFCQKSVLVLGGAGGIGKEVCAHLIQRGLKKLAIIDMVDEAKARELFKKDLPKLHFTYKQCSVSDEVELEKCMSVIKQELGGLDIVINSAGVLDELNPRRVTEINYLGVVFTTLNAIKLMRKDTSGGNGGFVINIASVAGLQGTFCLPVYSGTKHATIGFTRGFHNKAFYEKTGIKFMTICPGMTRTPLANPESLFSRHQFPELIDEVKKLLSKYPVQGPECVGKCVVTALDNGENGSVWQCENDRIEKIQLKEFPIF